MKNLLLLITVALTISFGISQLSFSRCELTGPNQFECNSLDPNPDPNGIQQGGNNNGVMVEILPEGNIDTNNFAAIDLGNGPNHVDVKNATVEGLSRAINTGIESDEITLDRARLESTASTLFFNSGNDHVIIKDSIVVTTIGGITISVGDGDDTALISGSTISTGPNISRAFTGGAGMEDLTIMNSIITNTSSDVTVSLGVDDDKVFVSNSTITNLTDDFPLRGAAGNDELTIGTEAIIPGGLDCDFGDEAQGFDTLIFAMQVPASQITELTQKIENLPTPDGGVTINDIFYEYRNCDVIVAALKDSEPSSDCSLAGTNSISEPSALVGLLGYLLIPAVIVVRRRLRRK